MLIHKAQCPYCKKPIKSAVIEPIPLTVDPAYQKPLELNGVSYSCPSCHSVLSVNADPIYLRDMIVQALAAELRQ